MPSTVLTILTTLLQCSHNYLKVKCNRKLNDITNLDKQREIIQYNYEIRNNHREIFDTTAQIKPKNCYW